MSKKTKKASAKASAAKPAKKTKGKAAVVATPAPVVLSGRTAAVEQNGVRAPIKGVCRDVWDALDKLRANDIEPTSQHVKDLGAAKDWNPANASIELGRWRKFHGLKRPAPLPRMSAEEVVPLTA